MMSDMTADGFIEKYRCSLLIFAHTYYFILHKKGSVFLRFMKGHF